MGNNNSVAAAAELRKGRYSNVTEAEEDKKADMMKDLLADSMVVVAAFAVAAFAVAAEYIWDSYHYSLEP